MFPKINYLIAQHNFVFQSWNDRYSKGVWAAVGIYSNQIDIVRDLSDAGDMEMIPAMDYVFSVDWLPYVTGNSLIDAMTKLEAKLSNLPPEQLALGTEWSQKVLDAIESLYQASREDKLENLMGYNGFHLKPPSFYVI